MRGSRIVVCGRCHRESCARAATGGVGASAGLVAPAAGPEEPLRPAPGPRGAAGRAAARPEPADGRADRSRAGRQSAADAVQQYDAQVGRAAVLGV